MAAVTSSFVYRRAGAITETGTDPHNNDAKYAPLTGTRRAGERGGLHGVGRCRPHTHQGRSLG